MDPGPKAPNLTEQMTKLSRLHADSLLTDAEFEAAEAILIARSRTASTEKRPEEQVSWIDKHFFERARLATTHLRKCCKIYLVFSFGCVLFFCVVSYLLLFSPLDTTDIREDNKPLQPAKDNAAGVEQNKSNNARDSIEKSKKDILGFEIGTPVEELEKAATDKYACDWRNEQWSNVRFLICHPNQKNRFEYLRFSFTEHLNQNVLKDIIYEFVSGAAPQDMVASVVNQFKPKSGTQTLGGVFMTLEEGIELELALTSRPAQPAGLWRISLHSTRLPTLDAAYPSGVGRLA